jgi:Cu/Ag efflux pump CusA
MRERLTGEDETVTVRLYGYDQAILHAKAEEIRAKMAAIDGVRKPRVEQQAERAGIEVSVDLDKARERGLKPGDVRRSASTLVSGITVGSLFHDQKVVDVVVWGAPGIRGNPGDMQNLMIETEAGGLVRLADVANVKVAPTTSIIRRQGVSRRLDIEAEVSGRPLGDVTREVAQRVAEVSFPFEYHAQVLGEHVERQAALKSLYGYGIAAAVIIFLLLQAAFRSWRLAVLTILALPAALLGGLLVMLFLNSTAFLGGLLGLGAVFGIAVRNAVLLVGRFQQLEHREALDPSQAVGRGVGERLQPMATTAIATALVVLPFAWSGNIAGLEIAHPAALTILGGLVTSTLFSLVVMPALYGRFGPRQTVDEMALAAGDD